MRRILWMAAVGILVLAVAAPAMAMDFKFSGMGRERFYDHTAVGFNKDSSTNPGNNIRGADLLFRARFDASDDNGNIVGTIRLRYGKVTWGAGGGNENPMQFAAPAPNSNFNTFGGSAMGTTGTVSTGKLGLSTGGGLGSRGINQETEFLYLDFAMPFNVPMRIRAGLQPIYFPKGMIIDDLAAGVKAYGTTGPVSYELSWWRFDAGNQLGAGTGVDQNYINAVSAIAGRYKSDETDNNYDVYGARVDFALVPAWNTGFYLLYGDNRVNCSGATTLPANGAPPYGNLSTATANNPCPNQKRERPNWYFGWTNTGKIGIASWDFDFIYGYAKGGATGNFVPGTINTSINGNNNLPPIDVRGFALDAGVRFPIGPLTFGLGATYASGDDQKLDSPAYPGGYSPSWKGPLGATEFIGDGGANGFDIITSTQSTITNLWTIGAFADYNPVKALRLRMVYAFAGFARKSGNCAYAATGNLGCYGPMYEGAGFATTGPVLVTSTGPGTQDGVATAATANTISQGVGGLAGQSTLGQELDFQAYYTVWTNFNINATVGWFFPKVGDRAGKYMLQFNYTF